MPELMQTLPNSLTLAPFDETDNLVANTLRVLAIDAVQAANSGHPGLPLGAADVLTVLWGRFLKHHPADPTWADRDRFVLSAGHGSALLYAALHLWGYPLSLDDLRQFRQWDSRTPGHPERDPELGIEMTTGPLGQGFATAVGMALAERMLAARFNRPGFPLFDHRTYTLASDGDLMEGISHEAASLAGHLRLERLVVLYDDNQISIDGPTTLSFSDDTASRFRAYGWRVIFADGHSLDSIQMALSEAHKPAGMPTLIVCKTHIGFGSPRQDTSKAHGEPLGAADLAQTKTRFGWAAGSAFHVPEAARRRVAQLTKTGLHAYLAWQGLLAEYRRAYPELAAEWDQWQRGDLPHGWQTALPAFSDEAPSATRSASGKVLEALLPVIPTLVGGSADLTPSNNTRAKTSQSVQPGEYSGRYIHFGVREHGMGALLNGLALHGLRPYGGTFLVFSDYMKPAIRLAALMRLPVIYVFTHDSIGLGEDGPTHQPVEHLAALRAIPNLWVLRPADSRETRHAWQLALERTDGPCALILTRQGLPVVTSPANETRRGAYLLQAAPLGETARLALVASGSEVHLALTAAAQLAQIGVAVQVVSAPCLELFARQPASYRDLVLPPGVPCLCVEAGSRQGWGQLPGAAGHVLGLDHFGASAPYQTLYHRFSLTAEAIAARALEILSLA